MKQLLLVCCIALCFLGISAQNNYPLFSIEINKKLSVATGESGILDNKIRYSRLNNPITQLFDELLLENISNDTIEIRNLVPFGAAADHVYITGLGEHGLSRTHLFIPGKSPVNVICPDNAWELGVTCIENKDGNNKIALVRRNRNSLQKGQRRRFETILYPGGSVKYRRWIESFQGPWQEGLRIVFQKNYLYDTAYFDNSLFERKDLQWIRHSYVMHLMQAWDKFLYDAADKKYHIEDFIKRGNK